MDAKQRHRIELERVASRVKSIENVVSATIEQQRKEKESLSLIQSGVEFTQSKLIELECIYKDLESIIDNTLESFNSRVNQYNDHINKLQSFISDLDRTINASNTILNDNVIKIEKLKEQQILLQDKMVKEEEEFGKKNSDLNIYKTRLEKYIKDNNIPIVIQL